MRDLGGDEKHCGSILANGDASTATNAGRRVHGTVRDRFRDGNGVGVGCASGVDRNEAAGMDDAVERGAVSNQVSENRERLGAPRLNRDGLAILEMPHVQLASGGAPMAAVRNPVNDQRTHSANALTTVRIKGNRFLVAFQESFID